MDESGDGNDYDFDFETDSPTHARRQSVMAEEQARKEAEEQARKEAMLPPFDVHLPICALFPAHLFQSTSTSTSNRRISSAGVPHMML
jgi:hypothetical protein